MPEEDVRVGGGDTLGRRKTRWCSGMARGKAAGGRSWDCDKFDFQVEITRYRGSTDQEISNASYNLLRREYDPYYFIFFPIFFQCPTKLNIIIFFVMQIAGQAPQILQYQDIVRAH